MEASFEVGQGPEGAVVPNVDGIGLAEVYIFLELLDPEGESSRVLQNADNH